MKAAPVLRALNAYPEVRQTLVHTGQHYDPTMSAVFFRQLEMPAADLNLGVGSGTHAQQTAAVVTAFEPIVIAPTRSRSRLRRRQLDPRRCARRCKARHTSRSRRGRTPLPQPLDARGNQPPPHRSTF